MVSYQCWRCVACGNFGREVQEGAWSHALRASLWHRLPTEKTLRFVPHFAFVDCLPRPNYIQNNGRCDQDDSRSPATNVSTCYHKAVLGPAGSGKSTAVQWRCRMQLKQRHE
eukprot:4653753-Amphidinium_carterae.1